MSVQSCDTRSSNRTFASFDPRAMDTRTRAAAAAAQASSSTTTKVSQKIGTKPPRALPPKFQPAATDSVEPPASPNNRQPLARAPASPSRIARIKLVTKTGSDLHLTYAEGQKENQKETGQDSKRPQAGMATTDARDLDAEESFSMKALAAALPPPRKAPTKEATVDIGRYDGGFENEDDQPNKDVVISPEAQKILELDSSFGSEVCLSHSS